MNIGNFQQALYQRLRSHLESVAIEQDRESYSYAWVLSRSLALGRQLQESGLASGDFVGVYVSDRLEMIIGMLGVMWSGGVFVPLDPALPVDRLTSMVSTLGMNEMLILSGEEPDTSWIAPSVRVHEMAVAQHTDAEVPATLPELNYDGESALYVYFTSGSTGVPKAILGKNKSLLHFIEWERETFEIGPESRFSQLITPGFDAFLRDVFVPLFSGGRICLAPQGLLGHPDQFGSWVDQASVSHIHCVPSVFRILAGGKISAERFPSLERIFMSGERIDPSDLRDWYAVFGSRIGLVNFYGATETTMIKTWYALSPEDVDRERIPIGKAMRGAKALILNSEMQVCDVLEAGEIYIMTPYRSLGYYDKPVLNAEKFIANPYKAGDEYVLYKSGDKGRQLLDGNIEFLGRIDRQIKYRGVRIEPEELEVHLQQLSGASRVVVLLYGEGKDAMLCACLEGVASDQEELEAGLRSRFPVSMLPGKYIWLDHFPEKSNGKVDYKELESHIEASLRSANYVAAATAVEQQLYRIWSSILGHNSFGMDQTLFEVGANSIHLVNLIGQIHREFGIRLSIESVFRYSTLGAIARYIEAETGSADVESSTDPVSSTSESGSWGVTPYDRSAQVRLPLSYAQERLWFIDHFGGSSAYHIPVVVSIAGELSVADLERSIRSVLDRHESLRSVIRMESEAVWQEVQAADSWMMGQEDGRQWGEEELAAWRREEISRPFDLGSDYLLRASLVRLGAEQYEWVCVLHHIAADAWSLGILLEEVSALYRWNTQGKDLELRQRALQYGDYSLWQRAGGADASADISASLEWWKDGLTGVEPLELPLDYVRPAVQDLSGGMCRMEVGRELEGKLRKLAVSADTTLFLVLLAGFKVLLHRYSGQTDICVGTSVANRPYAELAEMIGLFVNTLAIRSDLGGDPKFAEVLSAVKTGVLASYEHQAVPFEQIVSAVVTDRDLSRSPVFQVMFTYHNLPESKAIVLGEGLSVGLKENTDRSSKFDMSFILSEGKEGIEILVEYRSGLFKASTIERMLSHYVGILESVSIDTEQQVSELSLMREEEQAEIMAWSRGETQRGEGEENLVGLFRDQVRRNKEAIALRYGVEEMSYEELDRRSEVLAGELLAAGIKKEELVGVCMERSFEMIISILAILKAGAAYVPIDPHYPDNRIQFIVSDAELTSILIQESIRDRLEKINEVQLISVDILQHAGFSEIPAQDVPQIDSNQLAYVIYTSGSTGQPKGVMIEHGAVVNLIHHQQAHFGITEEESILQFSNYCFDASVEQIFLALLSGSRLVLFSSALLMDIPQFQDLLTQQQITHLHATPGFLEQLMPGTYGGLKRVIAGGDVCTPALAASWYPHTDFYNEYGPTEGTVTAIEYKLDGTYVRKHRSLPIGTPLANTTAYILDAQQRPVPVGLVGELYLGGKQVGRGYWKRDALTDLHFLPDPFSPEADARMYRTGDYARWLEDGNIEFLGRRDDQVKIRGYRIELTEIEHVLRQFEEVAQVVVHPRQYESGSSTLVAWLRLSTDISLDTLRQRLEEQLPAYMIPGIWQEVDEIPLNHNGKVDRKTLLALPLKQTKSPASSLPTRPLESTVLQIWKELLELEQISIHDNFFAIGGNSLLTIRLASRLSKALQREVSVMHLFRYYTIASFVNSLETESTDSSISGRQTETLERVKARRKQRRKKQLKTENKLS